MLKYSFIHKLSTSLQLDLSIRIQLQSLTAMCFDISSLGLYLTLPNYLLGQTILLSIHSLSPGIWHTYIPCIITINIFKLHFLQQKRALRIIAYVNKIPYYLIHTNDLFSQLRIIIIAFSIHMFHVAVWIQGA